MGEFDKQYKYRNKSMSKVLDVIDTVDQFMEYMRDEYDINYKLDIDMKNIDDIWELTINVNRDGES